MQLPRPDEGPQVSAPAKFARCRGGGRQQTVGPEGRPGTVMTTFTAAAGSERRPAVHLAPPTPPGFQPSPAAVHLEPPTPPSFQPSPEGQWPGRTFRPPPASSAGNRAALERASDAGDLGTLVATDLRNARLTWPTPGPIHLRSSSADASSGALFDMAHTERLKIL